jgi:hypothetical protein
MSEKGGGRREGEKRRQERGEGRGGERRGKREEEREEGIGGDRREEREEEERGEDVYLLLAKLRLNFYQLATVLIESQHNDGG